MNIINIIRRDLRLPGNPRNRIEGESPLQEKGHTVCGACVRSLFLPLVADDPESQARTARFLQGLQELGWTVGRNVQIDWRWFTFDRDRDRTLAAELAALAPSVLPAAGATVLPMREATRSPNLRNLAPSRMKTDFRAAQRMATI